MSLRLPRVDQILEHPSLASSPALRSVQKRLVQEALAELRAAGLRGELREVPTVEEVGRLVAGRLDEVLVARPRALINATGVLLHTNLGRAVLSQEAVAAMTAAAGTCELEFVVESGERGSRMTWLRPLLAALTGAEDVHVVNNGAAALLLACTAIGGHRGVVLSRGQMVEIGDGFRVAEMATAGGARLWEVGSTNRTHIEDYVKALAEGAGAILWVHPSNFQQVGFVHQPGLAELAGLGKEKGAPVIADLGSGSLGGFPGEPTIQEYLSQGADLVTCSGDKLLGGPQAGIVAGKKGLVERCRRFPMARALRPDKTTVAALHATAIVHATGGELPLGRMIGWSEGQLRERALRIVGSLGWPEGQVRASAATVGGGSLPGEEIASVAVVVGGEPEKTARALRVAGVVGRVRGGEVWLDLRSVLPEQDEEVVAAIRAVRDLRSGPAGPG